MSDTAPPMGTLSPQEAQLVALMAEEGKFVGQVVRAIRAPNADPDKVRAAFEHLDPADALRLSDRAADAVQRRASRTGDFSLVDRLGEFLPGQFPRERATMEAEIGAAAVARGGALDRVMPASPVRDAAEENLIREGHRMSATDPFERIVSRPVV